MLQAQNQNKNKMEDKIMIMMMVKLYEIEQPLVCLVLIQILTSSTGESKKAVLGVF